MIDEAVGPSKEKPACCASIVGARGWELVSVIGIQGVVKDEGKDLRLGTFENLDNPTYLSLAQHRECETYSRRQHLSKHHHVQGIIFVTTVHDDDGILPRIARG